MTPYERIMVAASKGESVTLTAEEVRELSIDSNIADYAYYRFTQANPGFDVPWQLERSR